MAVILPLLLLLTFGALKYGWLFFKHQQVTNAARQMARVAIRPGDRADDLSSAFADWEGATGISDADYTIFTGYDPNGLPIGIDEYKSANVLTGSDVIVSVSVPTVDVDILNINMFSDMTPNKLSADFKMTKEGFSN